MINEKMTEIKTVRQKKAKLQIFVFRIRFLWYLFLSIEDYHINDHSIDKLSRLFF